MRITIAARRLGDWLGIEPDPEPDEGPAFSEASQTFEAPEVTTEPVERLPSPGAAAAPVKAQLGFDGVKRTRTIERQEQQEQRVFFATAAYDAEVRDLDNVVRELRAGLRTEPRDASR